MATNLRLDDTRPTDAGACEPEHARPLGAWHNWFRNNLLAYSARTQCLYVSAGDVIHVYRYDSQLSPRTQYTGLSVQNKDPSWHEEDRVPAEAFSGPEHNYVIIGLHGETEYLICLTGNGRIFLRSTGHLEGSPLIYHVSGSAWSVAIAQAKPMLIVGHNGKACAMLDLSLPPEQADKAVSNYWTGSSNVPCLALNSYASRLYAVWLDVEPTLIMNSSVEAIDLQTELNDGDNPTWQLGWGDAAEEEEPGDDTIADFEVAWACLPLQVADFGLNRHSEACHLIRSSEERLNTSAELVFVSSVSRRQTPVFLIRPMEPVPRAITWESVGMPWFWSTLAPLEDKRPNLVKHVPHLGCIVVADQFGCTNILELCHIPADKGSKADASGITGISARRLGPLALTRLDDDPRNNVASSHPAEFPSVLVRADERPDGDDWFLATQIFYGMDVVPNVAEDSADIVALDTQGRFLSWTIRRSRGQAGGFTLQRSLGRQR